MEYAVKKANMSPKKEIGLGLLCIILGVGSLIYSFFLINLYNEKNRTYIETYATVVDYNYDSEGLASIIVEYTVDGQTYRKTSTSYSKFPKSIGTEVKVKYNPKAPNDAIWEVDSTNFLVLLVGVVFTAVGVLMLITSIKKMKSEKMQE